MATVVGIVLGAGASRSGGRSGHPFVFQAASFSTLADLHGDRAAWRILEARPDLVGKIPVARALPRDVDTWEDYEAARLGLGVA